MSDGHDDEGGILEKHLDEPPQDRHNILADRHQIDIFTYLYKLMRFS